MKDLLWVIPNFISSQECEALINECNKYEKIEAKTGLNKDEEYINNHRKSRIAWVNDNNIKQMMLDGGMICNKMCFAFNLYSSVYTFDTQFTEYESSYDGKFEWHIDYQIDKRDGKSARKLTVILQLTDPSTYEGGDLKLKWGHDEVVERYSQGTLLAFPSFVLHQVTPLTAGKRNSLISWIEGPDWT